jgi:hypothetical protein
MEEWRARRRMVAQRKRMPLTHPLSLSEKEGEHERDRARDREREWEKDVRGIRGKETGGEHSVDWLGAGCVCGCGGVDAYSLWDSTVETFSLA